MCYSHYRKPMATIGGRLTALAVDDEMSLSFVFPACVLHLVRGEGADGRAPPASGAAPDAPESWVPEDPPGTFTGLRDGEWLWVVVEEDPGEAAAAAERQAAYVAQRQQRGGGGGEDADGGAIKKEAIEGCSCIWGNPCAEPYGCQDFAGRFALAKAHGWKGHS